MAAQHAFAGSSTLGNRSVTVPTSKCWHLPEIVSYHLATYSNVRPEMNQISRLQERGQPMYAQAIFQDLDKVMRASQTHAQVI